MNTKDILNEREKTHGNFIDAAETHYKAKALFRPVMQANQVPLYRIEAIEAIIAKINRIAHGNHNHADHWDDIAGYATLGKIGSKEVPMQEQIGAIQQNCPFCKNESNSFAQIYPGSDFLCMECVETIESAMLGKEGIVKNDVHLVFGRCGALAGKSFYVHHGWVDLNESGHCPKCSK